MLQSIRSRGVLHSVGILINRFIPAWLFRFRIFRIYELQRNEAGFDSNVAAKESKLEDIRFQWCETQDELRQAQQLTYFQSNEEASTDRFSACLAFVDQGETSSDPVGGVWVTTQKFDEEELGVRILLGQNYAWIFAAFVAKSHRGQGIYKRLLEHVLSERATGERPMLFLASINPTNVASIAAHRPFIRSTLGICIAARFLGLSLAWSSNRLKLDRHASLQSEANPLGLRIEPNSPIDG